MNRNWQALPLLVLGCALGLFAARALEPLVHEPDLRREPLPCREIGTPFHHRLRSGCADPLPTPRGQETFSVNEDHLRDLARPILLKRPGMRVLVLGGDFVEGRWASSMETISSMLSARIPGFNFVNAGLAATGPLEQVARLPELLKIYGPSAVVWFPEEAPRDRAACALLENPKAPAGEMRFSTADEIVTGWRARLGSFPLAERLKASERARLRAEFAASAAAASCGECRAAVEMKRLGVPVIAFSLPNFDPVCLEKSGFYGGAALPATLSPLDLERLRWPGDDHLSPDGTLAVSEALAPVLKTWLEKAKPRVRQAEAGFKTRLKN
ncbi:MAG: hypothetical protein ACXWP1_07945 [Bdellovibrionota bacterium]